MKKLIIVAITLALVCIGAYLGLRLTNQIGLSDLQLANIEALTQEEYVIGPFGTNWKKYRIECTYTIGVDCIITASKSYSYWTDACGAGSGSCLAPAGC